MHALPGGGLQRNSGPFLQIVSHSTSIGQKPKKNANP
jgi:hypothetical protein